MNFKKSIIMFYNIMGKFLSILGYLVIFLIVLPSTLSLLTRTSVPESQSASLALPLTLTFLFLGVCLILVGRTSKYIVRRSKLYAELILFQNVTSLNRIAQSINKPVKFVTKDIQNMINRRIFTNMYIDAGLAKIIIGSSSPYQSSENTYSDMEAAKCSGCGALNAKPEGKTGICEYCGSPLN